ncbi:MAG: hypothetical protein Q9224_005273 [Gallowayella concinna]
MTSQGTFYMYLRLASVVVLAILPMMFPNPLDEVLELEDTFYKEGYDLGVQDGSRAGRIQGRLFGLEKSFEKYITMGKLHGRSVIWSTRLSTSPQDSDSDQRSQTSYLGPGETDVPTLDASVFSLLPRIPHNPRLEKHLRTLNALTEPARLSTENTEEALSDFDDRWKRAEGKVKIIEKLLGEESLCGTAGGSLQHPDGSNSEIDFTNSQRSVSKGDGGLEDVSALQTRH